MDGFINFIKNNIRLLLGAAVVILISVVLISAIISKRELSTKIQVADQTFNVEVARSDKERQIGLSEKEVLGENDGMLFVFDKPDYYSFWMRNMKFPIDIIYINGDRVTTIIKNATPSPSNQGLIIYQPKVVSDKVFEVNAGIAEKYNIKEGSLLKIENL